MTATASIGIDLEEPKRCPSMGAFGTAATAATTGTAGTDARGSAAEAATAAATAARDAVDITFNTQTALAGTAASASSTGLAAARSIHREVIGYIQAAHGISSLASTAGTASHAIFNPRLIIILAFRCITAVTASASTCADARTGTAATVAAVTIAADPIRGIQHAFPVTRCVTAVRAVATVGRIAARGIDCALAEEDERVARLQFYAGTGTRLTIGISSRAGDGHAIGHIEIYRAQDGQTAAASVAVGERDIPRDVIVT